MKLFLQSTRKPELRFEIVAFDLATKLGTIKSLTYGTEFQENLDKANLIALGYRVEKEEADHA